MHSLATFCATNHVQAQKTVVAAGKTKCTAAQRLLRHRKLEVNAPTEK